MRFIEIYRKAAALLPDTPLSRGAVKAFVSADGSCSAECFASDRFSVTALIPHEIAGSSPRSTARRDRDPR
jgi:hypothetical protein